jgi:poly(3-hydroxybutyrate) depolymerase/membrane-bound acyltransferase YfiQ involved in biofilm formation
MIAKKNDSSRRIHEIDFARVITAASVVAVHAISATLFLQLTPLGNDLQTLSYHILHFNRELFMFVTGLVLVYVYYGKTYSKSAYYLKRVGTVVIPYVLWSVIYIKLYTYSSGIDFFKTLGYDLLTGNASFQLYYIILTIQFYAVFPFFLYFFKKVVNHPWIVLSVSFVIQVIFYYFDFHFLESGQLANTSRFWYEVSKYNNAIFFFYEFFFILGAFTAVNLGKIKSFLIKYGKIMLLVYPTMLSIFCWHYLQQVLVYGESSGYASSVLQPIMVVYALITIIFIGWLVVLWGEHKPKPILSNVISTLAASTFGIYLVHPIFLTIYTTYILPHVGFIPLFPQTILVYLFTIVGSTLLCLILLSTPWLSWMIGKDILFPMQVLAYVPIEVAKLKKKKKQIAIIFIMLLLGVMVVVGYRVAITAKPSYAAPRSHKTVTLPTNATTSSVLRQPLLSLSGCGQNIHLTPGTSTTVKLLVGTTIRQYILYLPKEFRNTSMVPLILSFHGFHSTAANQETVTNLNTLADQKDIIVAYPQGSTNELGINGWDTGLHPEIEANDLLFVSNMISQLQGYLCINPSEIYATGFSNGAGLVNLLACSLSNRIAAFAPVSGSYVTPWTTCSPKQSVSIIEFHGLADTIVPYNGNPLHHEPPILSWASHWASLDKCSVSPLTNILGESAIVYTWSDCSDGSNIVEYTLVSGKHSWPQAPIDTTNGKEMINEIMWNFFQAHKLPIPVNLITMPARNNDGSLKTT